ncbi:PKD domain-containing protein [Mucilaginibacter sp. PAMB04168]|uniref:PKD domain-containing protein n=1 Tax=Mucilaginibacter sp. PAMB04168 TaxID=3138567 RepID=UPI0031F5F93B
MVRIFTRFIAGLVFCCCVCGGASVYAQTVTIRNVDAGPYAPGSTIAATLTVTDANGDLNANNNKYQLYLSDANGNFAAEKFIGEFSGYYTGFVNGVLPANTPAGTGYKVRVKTTAPLTVSAPSTAFTVAAGTAVQAGTSSTEVSSTSPEVFGTCFTNGDYPFLFVDQSTPGSTVTANFFNDLSQADEQTISLSTPTTFTAKTSNYTILVKAVNNGVVGTKAYLLINNYISNSFQTQNSSSVCLPEQSYARVSYSVNITGGGGIQTNYPGTIYNIKWGDGSNSNLTYFQILATNGVLSHDYLVSSCGAKNAEGVVTNKFEVAFRVSNPYCPDQTKTLSGDQAVLSPPKNAISGPTKACTGKEVTFTNISYAGQIVSSTAGGASCENPNATYQWYINGQPVPPFNSKKNIPFKYTFTTAGTYTVSLKLTSATPCIAPDAVHTICVQDAPQAATNVPTNICIGGGPVTLTNASVVSNPCNNPITYNWKITPATGYTYAAGSTKNSSNPQIIFSTAGKYDVQLEVDNGVCDVAQSTIKTIIVSNVPTATLSPDFSLCGKGQILTFDNTTGSATRVVLTGTVDPKPDTYLWTVVGQNGVAPATFVNNTTANSQYPQISFPDFGTYDVTVKHTNDCGTVTSQTQHITFKEAPTLTAGTDQTVCFGSPAQLDGSVTGAYNTLVWTTSGTGTFSNKNIDKPVYTPSAADRTAGQVKLTVTITTTLPGDCATIKDDVIININPQNDITSPATKIICTGGTVAYVPTSTVAGSTFNWQVTQSSANVSGFTASGSGDINDVLVNSSPTANGTVTYTIVPNASGCDGTPFNLTVTVVPKPEINLTGQPGNTICSGSPAGVQFTSNVTGTRYTWTVATTGDVTGAADQGAPTNVTGISQVLINTGTVPATVTYTVTPYNTSSADNCSGDAKTITITVQPQVPDADAGTDAVLCNQATYQLKGNDPGSFTGTWTLISGQSGVSFTDATKFNTTVSGLQQGQVYTFRWTITGAAQCTPKFNEVKVTNNPPISNNTVTLTSPTTCSGQNISITGSTPTGGSGTYTYLWESSADGTNWLVLSNQTGKNLNMQVIETTYFRRSVSSGACTEDKSNVVQIMVQPAISGNSISIPTTDVCVNHSAGIITGSTPAGADGNFSFQWQSSTDGGNNWSNITGATDVNYTTPVLIGNIQYRRVVSSLLCNGVQSNYSNTISITVNPDAKAEFTWTKDADCIPFALNAQNIKGVAYPDRNADYTWYANNQIIGTGVTFPGYTINTDGETVEIRLVVTSKFGCESAVSTHIFKTVKFVTASYTQTATQNCGTTNVTFTNTSTPIGGGTYLWDFGNGITSTKEQPDQVTFAASTDGKDVEYTVKLTATTSCSVTTMTSTVTIKPAVPVARISPKSTSGCAPFSLVVDNISPGNNDKYIYHVVDASGNDVITPVPVNNKAQQTLVIPDQGNYSVYMEAQSTCGTGRSAGIPIVVSARTVFAGITTATTGERFGCAPHTVNFINTSQGGTFYRIDWGDGSVPTTTLNTNGLPHTFTRAGTYQVILYATNDCAQNAPSQAVTVVVSEKPAPAFTPDNGVGCKTLTVNFANNTPEPTNAGDFAYSWNFGDARATASNPNTSEQRTPPAHTYDYLSSPYTVTLTVTNRTTGCTETTTRTITVNAPSIAEFRARPDSIQTYPNYTFSFEDLTSNNPKSWRWNFGDGSASTQQNPTHAYADTGLYKVTLTTSNQYCGTTKTHYVRITGIPGQLYVPNAFTPSSTNPELRTFATKGSGLRQWHMRIFNNYGQMVWETTKLDARGEPTDSWDGTFQGSPLPQGVYIWQIEASFINGSEWKGMSYNNSSPKRTGAIHLIR